jgi:DNA-binding transcriptional regulator YiaG
LSEAQSSKAPQLKIQEKEDSQNMAENKIYAKKLEAIISDLTERYLTAESIIKDLLDERVAAEDILSDVSKRYITSEAVIKELRSYALKLESTLADVVSVQKVSEEVIADLRERYTLSEQVIAELRDRYTLSEEVIASLRDRNSLSEGVIAELHDKVEKGKQTEASEVTEGVINNLKNRLQVSEDVIAELSNQVKEAQASKEQAAPARIPVPANYFEEIASKYRISVQEAKETFKKLGCKKKAFEFHLEERKKLISNHYGEYPYMIDKAPGINVYESKDMSAEAKEKERIARIVAHTN